MSTVCVQLADVGPGRRRLARARRLPAAPLAALAVAAVAALSPARAAAECFPLSMSPMTFSAYSPVGPGVSATATLSYLCWGPTPSARIAISTPRTMRSGASSLEFELYQDPGHTVRFPSAPLVDVPVTFLGTFTVYGFLRPQDAAPGIYSTELTVTGLAWPIGLTVNTVDFVPSCTIGSAMLEFGDYDPLSTTPRDVQTTITVACTRDAAYSVVLGPGNSFDGTTRQMSNGAGRLTYELYSDPARQTKWNAASPVAGTAPSTAPIPLVVYGRIPPRQLVRAGAYDDVVQSTINF